MSLPLLHAGRTNPGLSAQLDLRFALDKSLTAYRGPTPSFSRASTGSYFDGSGVLRYASINVQSYSEDFSNAYWTKANSSVLTDQTASPDGKNTADKLVENSSTAFHQIYNTGFSTTSGSPATISVYVKTAGRQFVQFYISSNMGNGYANFDIVNGTLGTVSGTGITAAITNVGNGWFRISASQSSCTTGTAYFQLGTILTSTSTQSQAHLGDGVSGVFIWGAQGELSSTVGTYVPTTSSANSAPRFDHTFNGTSWVSRGLLVEEQRTNSLTYSENFSNAYWTKFNSPTLTADTSETTSPDGNNAATKVVSGTTSETDIYRTGIYSGSASITFSIYAKAGTSNFFGIGLNGGAADFTVNFDLLNGTYNQRNSTGYTGTSISITSVGNGWYRCSLTATNPSVSTGVYLYCCANSLSTSATTNGNSMYLFGAQFEVGAFQTSYIKSNSGSAATRSADVCQITGTDFSSFWNASEGSFAIEADAIGNASANPNQYLVGTSDGTSGNQIAYIKNLNNLAGDVGLFVNASGVVQAAVSRSAGTFAVNTVYKMAAGFKANDFADSFAGGAVITDTSGSIPTVNRLAIGDYSGGGGIINGHIARLRYFNRRLTDKQLEDLCRPEDQLKLDLKFSENLSLTPVVGPTPSFSRASTGTYFNASGVLTSASINTPRFDHVYSGGQWVSRGLLIEEQRTNICQQSESFSNASWTISAITRSSSGTTPQGTNATLVTGNPGSFSKSLQNSTIGTITGQYVYSVCAKAGTHSIIQLSLLNDTGFCVNFDLSNKTYSIIGTGTTSASVTDISNGWLILTVVRTIPTNAVAARIFMVDSISSARSSSSASTGNFYLGFCQVESGAFATSYIPTTTTPVVRSADVCQITGADFSGFYNQSEGSYIAEWDRIFNPASVSNASCILQSFIDGNNNDRYAIFYQSTGTVGERFNVTVGNVEYANIDTGASVSSSIGKMSVAYRANDFATSINGASILTDTSGPVISGADRLAIGKMYASNWINGHISRIRYYAIRLPNRLLIAKSQ